MTPAPPIPPASVYDLPLELAPAHPFAIRCIGDVPGRLRAGSYYWAHSFTDYSGGRLVNVEDGRRILTHYELNIFEHRIAEWVRGADRLLESLLTEHQQCPPEV